VRAGSPALRGGTPFSFDFPERPDHTEFGQGTHTGGSAEVFMGKKIANADFERFARRFVSAYWQDVIDHPGLEPIEETLDALLATISWELVVTRNEYGIIMRDRWSSP
jgi:hypothetical protein